MIRSITRKKPDEELQGLLAGLDRIFIVGCGTCTTLTKTGGAEQVEEMKSHLAENGKIITGTAVFPVVCDNLTHEAVKEFSGPVNQADALLIMSCAYGVQNLASRLKKMVVPALDTLFIGKETGLAKFDEVCTQCGTCVLGETGGICPVTSCHKGLVNGPCGGTNNGKCEIDKNKDCAWTLIYERLAELDRLDLMKRFQPPRNHHGEPSPGKILLE